MQKLLIIITAIYFLTSCGSKEKQDTDATVVEESVENTSTYTPTTSSHHTNPTIESINQNTNQQTSSTTTEFSSDNGYRFGYDMGYIAGQNNYEYNPYLPNTSNYPMTYRQAYFQGYDVGYQKGQEVAGHSSYYVNTGDEDDSEIYYYEDDEDF